MLLFHYYFHLYEVDYNAAPLKTPYKAYKYRLCRELRCYWDYWETTGCYSNSSRVFYRQLINADISCIFGTSISQNIALFTSFSILLVAN